MDCFIFQLEALLYFYIGRDTSHKRLVSNDNERSANGIRLASDELSIFTISQILQYLLSISRLFRPCIFEYD